MSNHFVNEGERGPPPSPRTRLGGTYRHVAAGGAVAIFLAAFSTATHLEAQVTDPVSSISSLAGVKPVLPDVSEYIADVDAARQLGKALFWDTQVGSDGQACASCHFHAGVDIRTKNQVDPGLKGNDSVFDPRKSNGEKSGPNKQFVAADFPFHLLSDTSNRESKILFTTNDVFSSSGTRAGDFVSSNRSSVAVNILQAILRRISTSEKCSLTYSPATNPFHANNLIYRKVEPRQTPTTVNAVFNTRQFWDGRANNQFNGVDPFGPRTFKPTFADPDVPGAVIGNPDAAGSGILAQNAALPNQLELKQPLIQNASLASQAVGPPLSDFEMSCNKKKFADLGRKLIGMKPLSAQAVDPNDSLFSKTPGLVRPRPLVGLNTTYGDLIKKAFKPKYWQVATKVLIDPGSGQITKNLSGYTQMEHNFSLFWGLAVQAYEQILISDDSPFDRGPAAMSQEAKAGMEVFLGKGKCVACHKGPLMSGATVVYGQTPEAIEGMLMGDGNPAIYDNGFYNIGVRPTAMDTGVGGFDPYGFSLNFTRQYKWQLFGEPKKSPDKFDVNPCNFEQQLFPDCNNPGKFPTLASLPRDAVDGAFKTPILRNVGLTPPYFHNGGESNLKDLVRFYNRGGNRRGPLSADTTGFGPTPFVPNNPTNLDPDIGDASNNSTNNALGLTETEMDNLVQFLLSLTDQRVACHSGVFDHPDLQITMGALDVPQAGTKIAKDIVKTLPAVGQQGYRTCFPNSGDLFGSLNKSDPRNPQDVFNSILK